MVWRLRRSRQISFVPLPWRCSPGEASHYYLKRRLSGIGVNCVGAPRRREVTRLLKSGTMRRGRWPRGRVRYGLEMPGSVVARLWCQAVWVAPGMCGCGRVLVGDIWGRERESRKEPAPQWQVTMRGLGDLFISRLSLDGTREPFYESSGSAALAGFPGLLQVGVFGATKNPSLEACALTGVLLKLPSGLPGLFCRRLGGLAGSRGLGLLYCLHYEHLLSFEVLRLTRECT